MAEKKIPRQLICSLFNCGTPPTMYQTWKDTIIKANNIEREFCNATSHNLTTTASSKNTASACNKTHLKSGSKSKSQDKKKPSSTPTPNPHRPMPNRWALCSRSQNENVSSAGRKDTGRKIVLTRRKLSSYMLKFPISLKLNWTF